MCTFPAKELLALSHEAAETADSSSDPEKLTFACGFIKAVNDLRFFHEDLTGCQCWHEAVAGQSQAERVRDAA